MSKERNTIKRLKQLPRLFRKQDFEKVAPHTGMFLSRALKNGLIHRINRGHYINSFIHGFPEVEEVACFLKPPAYISCEWALNYHSLSLQSPYVCTVITLASSVGKNRNVNYQGVTIEFSKISPPLFFGYTFQKKFYIADPEKAILDTLYYRPMIPAYDELELDAVNVQTLLQMVEKYPNSVYRKLIKLPTLREKLDQTV
jgi:predicted transcriptional regulator of viral defense system